MPTPSDPTPVPEKSHDEMASAAQAAIDEQNRAIEQRKAEFERLQQGVVPHQKMPYVVGIAVRRITLKTNRLVVFQPA